jgi:asparagine synthase (glutamine-hydrolysing)
MCGIDGKFSSQKSDSNETELMTAQLRHRGPDAEGYFTNSSGTISFGHTRLCILDLSSSANQPFHSGNGRYVVVFNGEIYNYRQLKKQLSDQYHVKFKTSGDTEVIAEGFAIWGKELINKLEGMFAFVIADLEQEKLFLVRDRVGKKPLYYFVNDNEFYFASEIKALVHVPSIKKSLVIHKKSIASFLHLGFVPEPHTIYHSIKKFPAGHIGEITKDMALSVLKFWDIDDKISAVRKSAHAIEELHSLLEESVRSRLVSDVPVGTFLSGGTDSSLITAIASKQVSLPLKTYSIGFKESKFDERKFAEAVAKALKTEHTAYELSEKDALDLVEVYLNHFDEPFADTSAIPTMLVSRLARKHVTVALTGDGGDELFQGYGSYLWAERLKSPLWKLSKFPLRILLDLTKNNRFQRVSDLLDPVEYGGIRSHIFSQEQYLFSQKEIREKLLPPGQPSFIFEYNDPDNIENFTAGELQALFDFHFYLKDDLLVKVDRASMYYGLECRCPLLDHKIIEFAATLDYSYKVRNGQTKWILKKLLRKFLPDQLVDRKKWGFSVPLSKWLKGDLKYLIDDYLKESVIRDAGIVEYDYVDELKKDFFKGKDYLYNRLWLLIVLHRWWTKNS